MKGLHGPPKGGPRPVPTPSELAGCEGEERVSGGIGDLPGRLHRYGNARHRAVQFVHWAELDGKASVRTFPEVIGRLKHCGEYLGFRHYYTVDEVRLHSADFCKQHLICPLCAIRRGSKLIEGYLPRFEHIAASAPTLKPVFITLTVRNSPDLGQCYDLLRSAMKSLFERRRDARKGKRGATEFRKVAGLVGTIELTNKGNGWHPHAHMVALLDDWIDQEKLSAEWSQLTGGSFIVGIQRLDQSKPPVDAFAEVFKYALKFSDMKPSDIWEASRLLRGARLVYSLGCFRGVEIPAALTDEPLENLPYVEWFYRYLDGKGYTL